MSERIMLDSTQLVVCPNCSKEFPLERGISRLVIDQYKEEFEKLIKEQGNQLMIEAAEAAAKEFDARVKKLQEALDEKNSELQQSEARIKKLRKEAEIKAQKSFEVQQKALQEELEEKDGEIRKFRQQELALRKEKDSLEEAKRNFELEQARKLDEARKEITKQVIESETERFKYREVEYQKKLNDALEANEVLKRKLEQGSSQLAGEVAELVLEELLTTSFPYDTITPIAKGVRGADVIQVVNLRSGQPCGTIIWEMKRAQNFSDKWIQKIKDDRSSANADIAVLVCTNMPKDCDEPFMMDGDVWVACDRVVRPLSETLRASLIELAKHKLLNVDKSEKMEVVFNYLSSSRFVQKVRLVLETFSAMQDDLNREKKAMIKSWAKREMQLSRISDSISGMVGDLQGMGVSSQLDAISHLSLPGGNE